jgi:hypothetical protein
MARFDRAQSLAERLISLNGERAILTLFSTTTPDPSKPWLPGDSTRQDVLVRAVFLNYNTQESGRTYAEGSEIHRDDKKVLVAARGITVTPNLQGEITRQDGTKLRIVKVKILDPNGQKILFELQART